MTSFRAALVSLVAVTLFGFGFLVQAADGAEAEARAQFVKLVDAARNKQVAQFKSLIATRDLAEMEAMEKEKAGFIELMMEFIAEGGDPKDYTAEVTGDTVTFVKRVTEKSSTSSGTQTTKVRMIREGNQWKFGKKRS